MFMRVAGLARFIIILMSAAAVFTAPVQPADPGLALSGAAFYQPGTVAEARGEPTLIKITPEEAKRLMDGEEAFILLDVRTLDEYNEGHIPGAALIPYDEIGVRAAEEVPGKDTLLLIYCRSGRRSALAAEELFTLGYTRVYDFGGILDWPYEVVK